MTPEEKFEKLVERIDALSQSVELMHSMHEDFIAEMRSYVSHTDSLLTILVKAVIKN